MLAVRVHLVSECSSHYSLTNDFCSYHTIRTSHTSYILYCYVFIFNYKNIHVIYTLPTHSFFFFFFNDPAPPEFSPLPLHAPLPICSPRPPPQHKQCAGPNPRHQH